MLRSLYSILITVIVAALLAGCAPRSKGPAVPPRPPSIVHEVRYPGETLAIIAGWYTGNPKNWQEIASFNEGINPNKIRIGDQIEIQRYLLKRENPFSKDYVRKFSRPTGTSSSEGEMAGGVKTDGGAPSPEVSGSTSSASSTESGDGSVSPAEDGSAEDGAPPVVDNADGASSSSAAPSGDGSGESASSAASEDRESLREKTRFELLEEILKGDEKAAEGAAPSAEAPN